MPGVVITDELRSCGAAHREVVPLAEHRSHEGLNDRAETSRQPARRRERAMKGFRSMGAAQRSLSAFSGVSSHFRPRRHLMTASGRRAEVTVRFAIRDQVTGAAGRPTAARHPRGPRPTTLRRTVGQAPARQRDGVLRRALRTGTGWRAAGAGGRAARPPEHLTPAHRTVNVVETPPD
ncbi:hypothetical protein GCM10010266_59550 [Streptomyces griseomycini]|nr:hypothetical protein GCM10010266_59550 [Streptomyces griseomycini]